MKVKIQLKKKSRIQVGIDKELKENAEMILEELALKCYNSNYNSLQTSCR